MKFVYKVYKINLPLSPRLLTIEHLNRALDLNYDRSPINFDKHSNCFSSFIRFDFLLDKLIKATISSFGHFTHCIPNGSKTTQLHISNEKKTDGFVRSTATRSSNTQSGSSPIISIDFEISSTFSLGCIRSMSASPGRFVEVRDFRGRHNFDSKWFEPQAESIRQITLICQFVSACRERQTVNIRL